MRNSGSASGRRKNISSGIVNNRRRASSGGSCGTNRGGCGIDEQRSNRDTTMEEKSEVREVATIVGVLTIEEVPTL